MNEIELLKRQLIREKEARKQAEFLLESKSLELYASHQELSELNKELENKVVERTRALEIEKDQLQEIIELNPLPMLICIGEENLVYHANLKALELFHLNLISIKNKKLATIIESTSDKSGNEYQAGIYRTTISGYNINLKCHFSSIKINENYGKLVILENIMDNSEMLDIVTKKEQQYKNLVENSSDIIFICNAMGVFNYVNPTAVKLTGYSETELLDMHFFRLIRPDYQKKLNGFYVFQLQNNIKSTYTEFPILTKEGKEMWLGQTVDLNINKDGSVEYLASCREISDRKKYEKALIRSEEKYRSIIENLELGLLEVDKKGIVVRAYPKFCKLTGYTEEELIGRNPIEFLVDEENRRKIQEESQKRTKGQPSVYELKLLRKDGQPIWVIISGAPFFNEKNELAGSVGIHLDITDRKMMEEELREAKLLAENSLKSKDQFVANISHEIRTPLNAIMGMSQLLEKSDLPQKEAQYVKAISKCSENLFLIVNDLLDFSKLESGKMELKIQSDSLLETVTDVAHMWEHKIEEKKLKFITHFDLPDSNNLFDATRLSGILSNLLHNAYKFTETGSISLSVKRTKQIDNLCFFHFSIQDTGIGIGSDQLDKIFDSFVQASHQNSTKKYGGTGLGLSITKNLIDMMGGKLTVKSEINKGTLFEFELCFEQGVDERKLVEDERLELNLYQGMRILLVEDNMFNQMMAESILQNWQVDVSIANDGREGIEMLKKSSYDLILMDIQMPFMDGVETTKYIRENLRINTPILALTANALEKDIVLYLKTGMNGIVLKPFRQHELYQSIKAIMHPDMKFNRNLASTAEQTNTLPSNSIHEPICDLTNLTKNCMGNEVFMRKMIAVAIEELSIKKGDLASYILNNDVKAINNLAHSLKPTITNVAQPAAFELVKKLEAILPDDEWKNPANEFVRILELLIPELKIELSQVSI